MLIVEVTHELFQFNHVCVFDAPIEYVDIEDLFILFDLVQQKVGRKEWGLREHLNCEVFKDLEIVLDEELFLCRCVSQKVNVL